MRNLIFKEKELTGKIISCAIEVHRILGPGLLESIYEKCFCHELRLAALTFNRQVALPIKYKGLTFNDGYRIDVVVENKVVVELKAVDKLLPIHEAQLLTYMKISGISIGLLFNFNEPVLKNGIIRRVL
ncbi:MAG: GxxExxY protein [FCB group bacterium]|nr:GxxExxY protein [FCB group bacterium]